MTMVPSMSLVHGADDVAPDVTVHEADYVAPMSPCSRQMICTD
jgi:hypothetical protein